MPLQKSPIVAAFALAVVCAGGISQADQLIVSTVSSTNGDSVVRYDGTTHQFVGGVATGDHGLAMAEGLADGPG